MSSILCLAHYCDTHGPTPLMVTEGLPVDCSSCLDDDLSMRRPSTTSHTSGRTESFGGMGGGGSRSNSRSEDGENGAQRATLRSNSRAQESSPAIETPPDSPRITALQVGRSASSFRRDSSFRKTYDENDMKRAIPCENCAITLPKKRENSPGAQGSNGKLDASGPILRTRKPYQRVARALSTEELSPPKSTVNSSNSSESGDSEAAAPSNPSNPRRRSQVARSDTSSSGSSFISTVSHTHFLDYTSTHEPLGIDSFKQIRNSCLRTLSCETLPPSSSQTTSPTSPYGNHFFAGLPGTTTSSGGPIFFGDSQAGFTTAYIFRIPDPTARGKRRLYALMAHSTHRERYAVKAMSFLSVAFRELAAWIQGLAEMELERSENFNSPHGERAAGTNYNTPTSSFLSGRNRGYDSKFAGMSLRARGLAELVGLPDFFIELHSRFVRLLIELGFVLGQ